MATARERNSATCPEHGPLMNKLDSLEKKMDLLLNAIQGPIGGVGLASEIQSIKRDLQDHIQNHHQAQTMQRNTVLDFVKVGLQVILSAAVGFVLGRLNMKGQ
jgi:hypothetical protein